MKKISRDLLYRLYWQEGKSIKEIAEELKLVPGTVWYWLKKYDIPRRPVGRVSEGKRQQIAKGKEAPYRNRTWLEEMYIKRGLTLNELAQKCGVSKKTICEYIKKFGLSKKKQPSPPKPSAPSEQEPKCKLVKEILKEMNEITVNLGTLYGTVKKEVSPEAASEVLNRTAYLLFLLGSIFLVLGEGVKHGRPST